MSDERSSPRDDLAIARGGIPVVLDLQEYAMLLAAVQNDTPRDQQTEKDVEQYRGAMDVMLRATHTPWQAHPDALRLRIDELLDAVDDRVSGRGLLEHDELERRAQALRELAEWSRPGFEGFEIVAGQRHPCGPPAGVAAHLADFGETEAQPVSTGLRIVSPASED